MRRQLVWLFLLLQATAVFSADEQKVLDTQNGKAVDDKTSSHAPSSKIEIVIDQLPPPSREPGADLVDAAVVELRKIPNKNHRRRRKSGGMVRYIFNLVLKALPSFRTGPPPHQKPQAVSGPLQEAVVLLDQAAVQNNSDALYLLAEMNFYGNYSHPQNLRTAFAHYRRLAVMHGNTTAQFMLGAYYSTGIGGIPRDQAKALLYYTFAAARGDTRAEMAVGFRHQSGIGTPKHCDTAIKYYKRAADKAIAWYKSGPPGGMAFVQEAWQIADDYGGIYGEGASVSSSGLNAIKASVNSDANAAIDDVIEYLDLMSQKGDSKASYNLGRIYYEGQRGLDRDMELAKAYFFMVAKRYWKKDGRILENYKPGIEKTAAKAAGFIGRMYLRGDGMEQSFERAKMWFERGLTQGDAQSQHCLGLMMLNGYGVPRNIALATELFKSAAEHDYSPAQVELGMLYLDQGGADGVRVASHYFELAARYGNIEAHYYLAEMMFYGVGKDRTCGLALQYYKGVTERVEPLVSSWAAANQDYEDGDFDSALVQYLLMAEQGYERAQNNVAFILDPDQSRLPVPSAIARAITGRKPPSSLLDNPSLALIYWTRSSKQGNVDSLVKMGDYYFYGIGTDIDLTKAVQCYTGASEYSQSAQALYNLGWMHENGVGLTKDYHLAKRYYDQALEINEEAYLPVTLSLLKLRFRSAWNTFTHGPIRSVQDEPKPKKDWSLSEWINNFLNDDRRYYEDSLGYDDIFDDTVTGEGVPADMDEEIDDIVESLMIIGIVMALVGLLYYRQYRQQVHRQREEERRRQEAAQQAQAAQAGVPPRRGIEPQFRAVLLPGM